MINKENMTTQLPSFLQGVRPMSYDTSSEVNKPLFQPNKTEVVIKNIAQQKQDVPVEEPTQYTQEDFYRDVNKVKSKYNIDTDTAGEAVMKSYQKKGIQIQGVDLDSEIQALTPQEDTEEVNEDISGLDIGVKAGEAIAGFGEDIKFQSQEDDSKITSGLKFLGNLPGDTVQLAGELVSVASDPVGTVKGVLDIGQGISDKLVFGTLNKVFGTDVQDTEKAVMVEAIGTELKRLSENPEELKQMAIENPADILFAVTGGLSAAKNTAKAKGMTGLAAKIEKAEALTNPIKIQAEAIKLPVKAISKGKTKLTENLVDSTIQLRPTDSSKVMKASGNRTPSQWLLEKGVLDDTKTIKGKEGIVEQLESFNKKQYDTLNEAVKSSKGTFKNSKIDQGIQSMLDELSDVPGVEDKFNTIKALQLKATKGEGLTLGEQLQVKRFIDNTLDLYKITGDPKTGAKKEGLVNIRRGIREVIENEATQQGLGDIKALSNDIQVSRLIKDSLVNRINTVSSNNMLSLSDWIAGTGLTGAATAGVVNPTMAIAMMAGKKIISTPQFKIFATKTLNLPDRLINKVRTGVNLTGNEALKVSGAVLEYVRQKGLDEVRSTINTQASKAKDSIGNLADDIADKTGARAKFIDDSGKSLDDFEEMGTTESALLDEAKKYSSADEFIKSQGEPLYHGSSVKIDEFKDGFSGKNNYGEGVYFTNSEQLAKYYSTISTGSIDLDNAIKKGGLPDIDTRIGEITKIRKGDMNIKSIDFSPSKKDIEDIKKKGFDGVEFKDTISKQDWDFSLLGYSIPEGKITMVFNPKKIKTESQLKEIYKKVNK